MPMTRGRTWRPTYEAERIVTAWLGEAYGYTLEDLGDMELSVARDGRWRDGKEADHFVFELRSGDVNEPDTECLGMGYVHPEGFCEGLY